jgi:serine/threonine protein kinase
MATTGNVNQMKIPYAVLSAMTNNFHESHFLGKGSFASVFKGEPQLVLSRNNIDLSANPGLLKFLKGLPAEVAVKRDLRELGELPANSTPKERTHKLYMDQADRNEATICSKYRHQYLCNLVALCNEDGPHRCLVFEICNGGNLFDALHPELAKPGDAPPRPILTAQQRFTIAANAAQAIDYLHCAAQPPVLHRDIKSDNILLAYNGGKVSPKVGDFGTARQDENKVGATHKSTRMIIGTPVYMPPEYFRSGHYSVKTDSYAFGIVLMELLTGQDPLNNLLEKVTVAVDAMDRTNDVTAVQVLLDTRPGVGEWDIDRAAAFARLAVKLTRNFSSQRLTVREALPMLLQLADLSGASLLPLGTTCFDEDTGLPCQTSADSRNSIGPSSPSVAVASETAAEAGDDSNLHTPLLALEAGGTGGGAGAGGGGGGSGVGGGDRITTVKVPI